MSTRNDFFKAQKLQEGEKTSLQCQECGKKFTASVSAEAEPKCPKCGSTDVDLAESKKLKEDVTPSDVKWNYGQWSGGTTTLMGSFLDFTIKIGRFSSAAEPYHEIPASAQFSWNVTRGGRVVEMGIASSVDEAQRKAAYACGLLMSHKESTEPKVAKKLKEEAPMWTSANWGDRMTWRTDSGLKAEVIAMPEGGFRWFVSKDEVGAYPLAKGETLSKNDALSAASRVAARITVENAAPKTAKELKEFFDDGYGPNDADYDMMTLQNRGNLDSWLRKKGICTHGWRGPAPGGGFQCFHCKKVFPSAAAMDAESRAIYQKYESTKPKTLKESAKLIPQKLFSAKDGSLHAVTNVQSFPPGSWPAGGIPIRTDMGLTLVVCTLDNGEKRYYGVTSAHLTSGLRMAVTGYNGAESSGWETVSESAKPKKLKEALVTPDKCPSCGKKNIEPQATPGRYRCVSCKLVFLKNTKKDESAIAKVARKMVEYDDEYYRSKMGFADPGGKSALRAATRGNPRNLPCPTCKEPNKLTARDRAQGYQCDQCADREEGVGYY